MGTAQLTAAGKQFQVIFDHSPLGMVILDTASRVLYANATLRTTLGVQEADLSTRKLLSFIHPDDSQEFKHQYSLLARNQQSHFQLVSRYVNLQGEDGWWRMEISHVTTEGHSPFIFGVIEDVTAQKSDENRLKKAKETAERATRTKSAFLANMSHEIRTPLHTISGMTELLGETHLDEEQKEYVQQVGFSAEVLLGLINDILDFSKIEAGKLSLEVIEFDLWSSVEEAVDMVSLEAHKKGLDVVVHLAPELPRMVVGDPVRIRQIILNLFNNAVKFTSKGEVVISARPAQKAAGETTIGFSVADTGIGIPKEKLARLFTAFTQADSSTTRKFGGTGLGLSISRSLVKMMGGSIGVKTRREHGSIFWFNIPFKHGEQEAARTASKILEGRKVLIVDDNASSQNALQDYIAYWGAQVRVADSGEAALSELREHAEMGDPFDLALVDLFMHGMDGWQLASEINSDKSINSTRLILMSPTGQMAGEAKMKLLRWFNAYVNKPVKWRDLEEAILTATTADLDLAAAEEDQVGSLEPVEELETEPQAARGHTIVVAEDHFVNQQLFKTILEKRGYEVILAFNGKEAFDAVRNHPVDLVFMDVHMPEVNGYEATELIRQHRINVPIVAVTANAMKGEAEKCLEIGMNGYLTKPFKAADLDPILKQWILDRKKGAGVETPAGRNGQLKTGKRGGPAKSAAPVSPPEAGKPDTAAGGAPGSSQLNARVFDFAAAVEAFMGKEDVVIRVLRSFIERVEAQLDLIEDSLDTGGFDTARNEAHAIKGGSWNLSAMELGDQAAMLEAAARNGDENAAREHLAGVRESFLRFRAFCERDVLAGAL